MSFTWKGLVCENPLRCALRTEAFLCSCESVRTFELKGKNKTIMPHEMGGNRELKLTL